MVRPLLFIAKNETDHMILSNTAWPVFFYFCFSFSLSGLVGVTAGCAVVEPWAAILIGIIAGWIYIGSDLLLIRCKLDDAVAAIQVHLGSGLWGVLATGLLASPRHMMSTYGTDTHPGFFYSPNSSLLPAQLTGIIFIMGWTFVTTLPFFSCLDYFGLFRVNALEEIVGLDMAYVHQEAVPNELNKEESSDDEEVRLAAYRQRFAERKKLRALASEGNVTMSNLGSGHDSFANGFEEPKESYPSYHSRFTSKDDDASRVGSLYSA
jgi:hypothetical protein